MRKWFKYNCFESDKSIDAEIWYHTNQLVDVLHPLKDTDIPMSRIRFSDGFECDAFNDELILLGAEQ